MTEYYTAPNGRSFPIVSSGRPVTKAAPKPKKANKYGNRKVVLNGIKFDSQKEAKRWEKLCGWEQAGLIRGLVLQPTFILAPSVRIAGEARKRPAVRYRADFSYEEPNTGLRVVEDVKSAPTAKSKEFRRIQHLMKSVHGIDIRIVR